MPHLTFSPTLLALWTVATLALALGLWWAGAAWGRGLGAPVIGGLLALGALAAVQALPASVLAALATGARRLSLEPEAALETAGFVGIACLAFVIGRLGGGTSEVAVARGARLSRGRGGYGRARRGQLTLAGIAIPPLDETKHFKLIGTTGTGKSTAIREMLAAALARGDRAVIADPDGGYRAQFYDPDRGDVILNPFDPDSLRWDLFAELRAPYDHEQLARSLIPEGSGSERTWRLYGQTFLAALLRQLHGAGITDVGELFRLITAAPAEELAILLEGTPAQAFLAAGNERMFGSIRSVTGHAVAALDFIHPQTAAPFSVRAWVRKSGGGSPGGVLFLPYRADQIAALRSIIATWLRLAIVELMLRPTGPATGPGREPPPCWIVVDELDALGAIDGLKDALARLRKFGGRCVLGFQSIAQVSSTYGHGEAQTIVENCGNTLILRCSASEYGGTAQFASRLIGEREVIRPSVSTSRSGGWLAAPRRSTTMSAQHVTEPAVLGSEIEQLPDLNGYLKLASRADWLRVRMSVR
jgi:type IV secretory pathway TraG/TraD family ATPase VirD4